MEKEIQFTLIGQPDYVYEGGCYDDCEEYSDCSPKCEGE